jgi:HSP20 family protein
MHPVKRHNDTGYCFRFAECCCYSLHTNMIQFCSHRRCVWYALGLSFYQIELSFNIEERKSDMQILRRNVSDFGSWSSIDQLMSLQNELNRLMRFPFGELPRRCEFFSGWIPPLDLHEDKDNFVVKIELPGTKQEAIDISLHDGALTISGERNPAKEYREVETFRAERFQGRFHRTLSLPKTVVPEQVKATYANGVLTITLPKAEEAKPKQIVVQAN